MLRHIRLKAKRSNSYIHSCKTYCLLTLGHTRLKAKRSNNYTHSCKITLGRNAQTNLPESKKSQLIIITHIRVKLLSRDARAHSPESKKSQLIIITHTCVKLLSVVTLRNTRLKAKKVS